MPGPRNRVGYVLALPFGHGCLGTAFMAPADLALTHFAMAMAPNLNLNLRKLFLFSFSFEENDKQKAQFSNECHQQSSQSRSTPTSGPPQSQCKSPCAQVISL